MKPAAQNFKTAGFNRSPIPPRAGYNLIVLRFALFRQRIHGGAADASSGCHHRRWAAFDAESLKSLESGRMMLQKECMPKRPKPAVTAAARTADQSAHARRISQPLAGHHFAGAEQCTGVRSIPQETRDRVTRGGGEIRLPSQLLRPLAAQAADPFRSACWFRN